MLAFSNMFGIALGNEPASVLHGVVAAKTDLAARRGAFETNYRGPAYVLDAMTNNPGAAGGALTDRKGRLAGLLGKELRRSASNIWLNYAIPIGELAANRRSNHGGQIPSRLARRRQKEAERAAHAGRPGPCSSCPIFCRGRRRSSRASSRSSVAAKAGVKPDDLVLFVNGRVVASCKLLSDELTFIDRLDPMRLTIQRGQELVEVELVPEP